MNPNKLGLGDIVWWSLPEDINVSRTNWLPNYPDFPLPPEPLGDPLRRALYGLEAPRGTKRLVRPLKQKDHWAIVIETPKEDDLDYRTEFTVRLNHDLLDFRKQTGDPSWAPILYENYIKELERVTPGAIADLVLRKVRGACLAIQARKTGGVYFVPKDKEQELNKIVNLVEALGGRLYRFPVDDVGRHRDDLIHLIVEDLKSAVDAVHTNLNARHTTDAITEGTQALDRVRFYREALNIVTKEAVKYEKELNQILVTALTKKNKKEAK